MTKASSGNYDDSLRYMIENENLMLNKEFVNNFSEVESAVEDM